MKVKCTVSYDGTHFKGYQVQPGQRTVQTEIECALARMHKQDELIPIVASGRTDSGVHAKGQVIHFKTRSRFRWRDGLLPSTACCRMISVF